MRVSSFAAHNVTIQQIGPDARFGYYPYLFSETWVEVVPTNLSELLPFPSPLNHEFRALADPQISQIPTLRLKSLPAQQLSPIQRAVPLHRQARLLPTRA